MGFLILRETDFGVDGETVRSAAKSIDESATNVL
jgi:hypothetical protein